MHSSPGILARLGRLAVVGILGARALSAQLPDDLAQLVLERVETAIESIDYRATQTRRIRGSFSGYGQGGEMVGAVETMLHRAGSGPDGDRFSIELRGIEGRALSAPELQQRQQVYRGQADYLFRFQSFRVFDVERASHNYSVHLLGEGPLRAQRHTNRIAVVSRTADRPSWLLDLDAARGFPLYGAQFSPAGRLVGELEVASISFGAAAQVPIDDAWVWTPRLGVESFPSFEQAASRAARVVSLPLANESIGAGYSFHHARVVTNPITGEQSIVQAFDDGIDSVFVTQRATTPSQSNGHTARYYSDAGVFQCAFQHQATEFVVVGRNSSLREMAIRIYRLAVASM
ncbi:MAG: hypothetical protein R3F56_21850 [Planctomycetota bacterium]